MLISQFDKCRDKLIDTFISRLKGKTVLELGCGSGDRTKLFYNVSSAVGVDIKYRVPFERKGKFTFSLADATALPFIDESFDAVVSFDVIEHIIDDKSFVSEVYRVCKKGGFVLLGTPNRLRLSNRLLSFVGKPVTYPYYLGPDTIHVREYTEMELYSVCKDSRLVGECFGLWVGLVGRIDKGLTFYPSFLSSFTQYIFFIGSKP
jgi:SAM-dependent methyltransferase